MIILCAFAHPDDETFGPGGTLALLSAAGHDLHLWCATRGEAGTIGSSAELGQELLAATREQELVHAARVLGLNPPHIEGYPDGGVDSVEPSAAESVLVRWIRRLHPELVITFHPNGISGHSDHKAVTRLVTAAVQRAAQQVDPALGDPHPVRRVLGYCLLESVARRITWRRMYSVADRDADFLIDTRKFFRVKMEAVRAHATQKPFIDDLDARLGGLESHWAQEAFQVLWGEAVPQAERPARSLDSESP